MSAAGLFHLEPFPALLSGELEIPAHQYSSGRTQRVLRTRTLQRAHIEKFSSVPPKRTDLFIGPLKSKLRVTSNVLKQAFDEIETGALEIIIPVPYRPRFESDEEK